MPVPPQDQDPSPTPQAPPAGTVPPAVLLYLFAFLAMGLVLRDLFVQDDTGIILNNPMVKEWSGLWRAWAHSYWPVGRSLELYRPLAVVLLNLQWHLGAGSPIVIRIGDLLCYFAAIAAVHGLLRRLAPPTAAWIGAAIFAVHPVHVEAVAMGVNQGETLVAALLAWCTTTYIDWRRGALPAATARWRILALFTVSIFIKEHTLILPGLFLAAELTVLDGWREWRVRLREQGGTVLALVLIGAVFWTIRGRVLGDSVGTAPVEVLQGLSAGRRVLTMLGVVPEWVRLLVWPAHLQAEWAPLEYTAYVAWSLRETVGVIALGTLLLALGISWGRRPVIAFALLWFGVAVFPVSNLVLVTGVIVAERTLFLASVAIALIVADLAGMALAAGWSRTPGRRALGGGLVAALLVTGLLASAVRMTVFKNRALFLASQVLDAPLSYRAHLAWGELLFEYGDTTAGETSFERAVALHPDNLDAHLTLARNLRGGDGVCLSARSLYALILERLPGRSDARTGLIACDVWLGRYAEAREVTEAGIARGVDADFLRTLLPIIDSASAAHAKDRTVRLPHIKGGWLDIGPYRDSVPSR